MALQVWVVTPEREVWSGEADFVVARSEGGDLGILPGHAPFLGSLHHARLLVQSQDSQTFIAIHGGFIEVFDDRVSVLAQRGEMASDIDLERAHRMKQEAERRIAEADTAENRTKLLRNTNRLRTAAEAGLLQT